MTTSSPRRIEHQQGICDNLESLRDLEVQCGDIVENLEDRPPSSSASEDCVLSKPHSTWNGRVVFLFSALGFTTGFHSICLFPVLCETNGGLAFVLCTALIYIILGLPTFLLEAGLGQLTKSSPAVAFSKLCPLLSGVGLSMCWSSIIVCITEACFMSWSVVYLYMSADCVLPWKSYQNYSGLSSAANYFTKEVLSLSSGLNEFGIIQGSVTLALAFTWFTIIICLASGIRNIGKISFVTTPLTLLLGIILLIRSCFLWTDTITVNLTPNWSFLTELATWTSACCYVFHSLNIGLGGLMTIASHNKSNTFILRDVGIICFIHFVWGIIMWLVYELLKTEYQVHSNNIPISTGGPWILFVVLAHGVASLPHGMVFAIITYSMAFLSGLSTLLGTTLTVMESVMDMSPVLLRKRSLITVIMCFTLFLVGIPMTSESGLHMYLFLAHYSTGWPLVLNALCICLVVSWSCGYRQFINCLAASTNVRLKESLLCHLRVFFTSILPVLLLMVLLICTLYGLEVPNTVLTPYTNFTEPLGWFLSALPVIFLPFGLIYKFCCFVRNHSFMQSLAMLVKPEEKWTDTTVSSALFSSKQKPTMTTPMILPDNKDCYCFVPNSDRNNNFSYHLNENYHDNIVRNALQL